TGYIPRSILATPLLLDGQVIGVMEVLDKIKAASFGLQDMELLGVFAQQAALAINQSQQYSRIGAAVVDGLRRLLDGDLAAQPAALLRALDAAGSEEIPAARDL